LECAPNVGRNINKTANHVPNRADFAPVIFRASRFNFAPLAFALRTSHWGFRIAFSDERGQFELIRIDPAVTFHGVRPLKAKRRCSIERRLDFEIKKSRRLDNLQLPGFNRA
jgi:hypothetical protein